MYSRREKTTVATQLHNFTLTVVAGTFFLEDLLQFTGFQRLTGRLTREGRENQVEERMAHQEETQGA